MNGCFLIPPWCQWKYWQAEQRKKEKEKGIRIREPWSSECRWTWSRRTSQPPPRHPRWSDTGKAAAWRSSREKTLPQSATSQQSSFASVRRTAPCCMDQRGQCSKRKWYFQVWWRAYQKSSLIIQMTFRRQGAKTLTEMPCILPCTSCRSTISHTSPTEMVVNLFVELVA